MATTRDDTGRDRNWIGGALLVLTIIVLFYPGVMTNDSTAVLKQARTLELTDWHPPVMALLWRYLDAMIQGPLPMLVAQALLYAWAVTRLCSTAFPALGSIAKPWVLPLLFGIFPPALALTGMIWKDAWMSGFLLLGLAQVCRMTGSVCATDRRRALLALLACCAAATAFRHNAVAATAGLLAAGVYYLPLPARTTWMRLFLSCCAGLVIAVSLWGLNDRLTRSITTPSNPTTSILLHDIAGTIVHADESAVEAAYFLSRYPTIAHRDAPVFLEQLHRTYSAGNANGILRSSKNHDVPFDIVVYRPHDASTVRHAWKELVARNPGAYLRHRTNAFACLLQLCDLRTWSRRSYVLHPDYLGTGSSSPVQAWLRIHLLNPDLARLYAPAFWLCISLLAGVLALFAGKDRFRLPVFIALSTLGASVALFFTSPIESYRYMHWPILAGWTCMWLAADHLCARVMRHRRHSDKAVASGDSGTDNVDRS